MLTNAIDAYLAIRRAAGFELRVTESLLRNYARFAAERDECHVCTRTAIEWAALAPSPHQRARRLEVVTIFSRHVQAEDPRHEVPPTGVFDRRRPPYRPFLYTPDQIRQLLEKAATLGPAGSLRPWTYTTLFSLLAVTGLRISEAIALCLQDLTENGLVIRETKFRKSRLVPLHPSTDAALARYLEQRTRMGAADEHVFISLRGRALNYPTVVATFLSLVRAIGLHPGPGQRGPRLHDLRHAFAVRALEACPHGRAEAAQHMLALATYLGHAKLESTYVYLHTTPHLLSHIADAYENLLHGGPRS
jgi:integrase